MKILINQRFGIGDCVFSMQIAKMWIEQGHKITWPVFPQFVSQLKNAYPFIEWLDCNYVKADYNKRVEHDWNGYRVVPLAWANEILEREYKHCMRSKYELFDLDFKIWKDGAMWERNHKKEHALFESYKGKNKGYNLVNETWGSDCKNTKGIITDNGLPTLYMNVLSDYSLFDWALVLERATEIHTVSTSIIYLLELLDIKCPIHLYPRPTDPQFKQVEYLFTKPYNLHI